MIDAAATIISLLALIASGAISIVVKMLWDTVQGIKRENERLATRVNALEVSIVKIASIEKTLEKIDGSINRLFDRFDVSENKSIEIRSTWIPRIQNLEEHYKEILKELKGLSKLNALVK